MNYFKRPEMACKCGCGFDTVDFELMEVMNDIREHFGIPLVITSGCRCKAHNENEGGASKSMHLTGKAADFRPLLNHPRFDGLLKEMHQYLLDKYKGKYGIARGSNFVHCDVRAGSAARWKY